MGRAHACVTGTGDNGHSDASRLVDHVVPGLDQQAAVWRSAEFHAELAAQVLKPGLGKTVV
ncbi:hypothetical protein ABZS71_28690 [Streptomyces sp. NPDC005393]|uniref:hypothetical protein n=1 Tax=Streptomyces sp. NPDC005393 TaxID=3157041 RepID=UPI00339F30E0